MKKLVDIFDFNGEFDLLELKIKYNEKFITEFWISDKTENKVLQNFVESNYKWLANKIKIFPNIETSIYDENLKNLFVTKEIFFDDIVIFSTIRDVYKKEIIDELDLHLPFGPHWFSTISTNENLSDFSTESVVGPISFYRSEYTTNPKSFEFTLKQIRGERKVDKKYILSDACYRINITEKKEGFIFTLD
jgi:hypothetical protein